MISTVCKTSRLHYISIILAACQIHQIAYTLTLSQAGRHIQIGPAGNITFIATQGDSQALSCKAVGDQPSLFSELKWTGPDRIDNWDELRKKHSVREGDQGLELEFLKPSHDDSGLYHCFGTFQSTESLNASIYVKVYNPVRFENCHERQYVVESELNQKVSCRGTGDAPLLKIFKGSQEIKSTNSRYKWDADEDGMKILQPADLTDEGTYTFELTSGLTRHRIRQTVRVEVHSKPNITAPVRTPGSFADFTGVEGEQAELKCDVEGKPRPLVYWIDPRLKRNLTSVGGYFVNPEKGTLLISKVNKVDDSGDFVCIAKNDVGETSRSVSMAVFVRPQITKFENKTVEEGHEAILECRATGFPRPKFSIRRQGLNQRSYQVGDGYVTDISEDEEGGGAQVYVYRVKVRANKTSYGLHYCNASNLAGKGPEAVNQLFVKYKPDLSSTPPTQYARLGKNATLTCQVRAYPAPSTINWYNTQNQQLINAPTRMVSSPDGQTHTINMQPPMNLEGNYRCYAKNELGEAEQLISMRFKQKPGRVSMTVIRRTPTTNQLELSVINDGGDRIKSYVYRLHGHTNDQYNPTFTYRQDIQNDTYIEASLGSSIYTIKNLLPDYVYKMTLAAVNDLGAGDLSEYTIWTEKPTRPEAPVIVKPVVTSASQTCFSSDYSNGYVLKWNPPDLDNGDPITNYIIRIYRVNPELPDEPLDSGEERIIEHSDERPRHAKLGPLESNRHYKIKVRARNKYGESLEAAEILVCTSSDRPIIPAFEPEALTWLTEPSTPILVGLLTLAIVSLIIIDIIFCLCYQIGVIYSIKNCMCPRKANSVISDKTYT